MKSESALPSLHFAVRHKTPRVASSGNCTAIPLFTQTLKSSSLFRIPSPQTSTSGPQLPAPSPKASPISYDGAPAHWSSCCVTSLFPFLTSNRETCMYSVVRHGRLGPHQNRMSSRAHPVFLGFRGFPFSLLTSLNEFAGFVPSPSKYRYSEWSACRDLAGAIPAEDEESRYRT